jgi:hypothetical protein
MPAVPRITCTAFSPFRLTQIDERDVLAHNWRGKAFPSLLFPQVVLRAPGFVRMDARVDAPPQ